MRDARRRRSFSPMSPAHATCRRQKTEEARMSVATSAAIGIAPTGAALGAEITGVDLRRIDAAAFEKIHRAWVDHQVLLFRGQSLDDDDLIAFSRRVGALDLA